MIDVAVGMRPAGDILALDLWVGEPAMPGIRMLPVEPGRWWLIDAGDTAPDPGTDGAIAPIGGGLVRATITGPGWRALLMRAGWFDAENPAFGVGQVAATVIHHVPVWIAPTAADACEVYLPASYAPALAHLWGVA